MNQLLSQVCRFGQISPLQLLYRAGLPELLYYLLLQIDQGGVMAICLLLFVAYVFVLLLFEEVKD
jgi:hypothetical protein